MKLKPIARESMLKQLRQEKLETLRYDIDALTDYEIKQLYLKSQKVRQGLVLYGVPCNMTFEEALTQRRLNMVTFSDTYKLGVRRMTLEECLRTEKYIEEHPGSYRSIWKN